MRRLLQLFAVATALLFIAPLSAQKAPQMSGPASTAGTATSGEDDSPTVVLPILLDRLNNPGTVSSSSQNFEPANNAFDDFIADDFSVPSGHTWGIQQVAAQGVYFNGAGPADSFNVFFYANSGSLPGSSVCTSLNNAFVFSAGVFTINLGTPCVLGTGTYWVSVQANQNFTPAGQWGWTDRTVQSGNKAAWQNPGGGFGVCATWGVRETCLNSPASEADQMFRLSGYDLNPLNNGGFETGSLSSWVILDPNPTPVVSSASSHTGTYSALLGTPTGPEPLGDGSMYQTISVPPDGGTLVYWWNGSTTDNISFDWQDAYITDTSGTILSTIMHLCTTTGGWQRVAFDMRPYASQTVRVKFLVHQDGFGDDTSMYVDDVSLVRTFGDTDRDRLTDRTVFRPSNGVWYTAKSGGGATATGWGVGGDIDVMGDYDGDGKADIAVFRPSSGTWLILRSSNGTVLVASWGVSGDIPLAGDIDGDGKDDLVVFRPTSGVWFVSLSAGGTTSVGWGINGDVPLLGDYDYDGRADLAIFRPGTGVWYILKSGGGTITQGWGIASDVPVVGDFDGDGKTDIGIFRPSSGQWLIIRSSNGSTLATTWGMSGDIPASGDWDGDGHADFTVFRPSSGVWFTQLSGGGSAGVGWGLSGDKVAGRQPGT